MKKLIIFDCDGVLVDSEIISSRISTQMLNQLGYPISVEDNIKRFTGMSDKSMCEHVLQETGLDLRQTLPLLTRPAVLEALAKELQPLMLPILASDLLKDMDKCVASSSPKERVLMSLRTTKQDSFFQEQHIFTASEVKRGKPAPDLFLWAAQRMGYQPQDCLVIEDSAPGIQAALAAKMPVIGFLGASHAKFAWYYDRIHNQDVPIAHGAADLFALISKFINHPNF